MVRRKNSIEECGDGNKRKRAGLHTQHQPSDHEGVQNFKQFHLSCVMEIHPIHSPLSYIDSYCERLAIYPTLSSPLDLLISSKFSYLTPLSPSES